MACPRTAITDPLLPEVLLDRVGVEVVVLALLGCAGVKAPALV
jgi:hypothetical protein